MSSIEALTTKSLPLGEGPCWHAGHQVLYWVNIDGKELHRFNPATGIDDVFPQEEMVGTVAPYGDDELLVALENKLIVFNPQDNSQRTLTDFAADNANLRSNDGKCDPMGRLWIGSLAIDGSNGQLGDLYRMDADNVLQHQLSGIGCSNGLAWDLSRNCMYYIDSTKRQVYRFAYNNESGAIENQEVFVEFSGDMGVPDGMTIDNDGCIWVAQWGGYGVSRFDPNGVFMQKIDCPARNVTACTFGAGADGKELNTLYITTAAKMNSDATEHDGLLYRCQVDATGQAAYHFKV